MTFSAIGFIGLGVMGEPIARHLARKSGRKVFGCDPTDAPFERLRTDGIMRVGVPCDLSATCGVIFLALPSGAHVETVVDGNRGLIRHARPGQCIVDLGTTSVASTRAIAAKFDQLNAQFVDAPVARTRAAAEDGKLSVMVGARGEAYAALLPLLSCFASDVTSCGAVGNGQLVKIMNNMVLTQTVVALAEALVVARASGVSGDVLFETLAKGSADSFALRNHGMKALLSAAFPERAFSARYMRKDIGYALELAAAAGITLEGAELADRLLAKAIAAGDADRYWPVIGTAIASAASPDAAD